MVRFIRRHGNALIAIAVYNFVIFFPTAFMGRLVSPNDVFYNFSPWLDVRPEAIVQVQNSLLNDPPTGYYTMASLARSDLRAFHWNPYIASGVPGFGSSMYGMLTPLSMIPLLLVPLIWFYSAFIFLKLNLSFVFAYLWLREERLGRRGAAVGAIIVAGAGTYAVLWLWQITNATVFYPALLWIIRRTFNGRRTSIALMTVVGVAYGVSAFPAAIAYGAWLAVAYTLFLLVRHRRRIPLRGLGAAAAAAALAIVISTPTIVPFAQFLKRTGYLEVRETTSLAAVYPISHMRSFIDPERLGNPVWKNWMGDPELKNLNNYVGATIYLGLLTLPLVAVGIFSRRARTRWFWLAAGAFLLACMFGAPFVAPAAARLPGIEYSPLARLSLLLPLPAGYLAAAAIPRRAGALWRSVAATAGMIIAFDLALLAGRFHPYLEPKHASVPPTPVTTFLQSQPGPFRIAPFFDYLWPNAAELVRVEDVRSHFSMEADYRRLMLRIDPTSWSGMSTVMTLNSLQFNFHDPLAGLLGIRWYIEHKPIDIIKWNTFSNTVPGVKETGALVFRPGDVLERTVHVDAEPFWAIEVPATVLETRGADSRLEATLLKHGVPVWSRSYTRDEANAMNKLYVPLRPYARAGERVTLRLRSRGLSGSMLEGENESAGETPLFYGRVTTPVVFDRELPDGRLFRNLAELPRFRAVSKLRKLNDEEFLAARDVDFATEAVITDDPVMPPDLTPARARVTLTHYAPHEQRITTESDAPFFLASSEKLAPGLRVTIDGRRARAIETDLLFAGVTVPAGRHEVVFSRRIARGWWWLFFAGAGVWVVVAIAELMRRRRVSYESADSSPDAQIPKSRRDG